MKLGPMSKQEAAVWRIVNSPDAQLADHLIARSKLPSDIIGEPYGIQQAFLQEAGLRILDLSQRLRRTQLILLLTWVVAAGWIMFDLTRLLGGE